MPLKSRIPKIVSNLIDASDDVAINLAQHVKSVRDMNVRVDTGALLDSDKIERVGAGAVQYSEGDGLPDARASFTNYGTSRMRADAHMDIAAESGRVNASKITKEILRSCLK